MKHRCTCCTHDFFTQFLTSQPWILYFFSLPSLRLQSSSRGRSTRLPSTTGVSGLWCLSASQGFGLSYPPGSLFPGSPTFHKFSEIISEGVKSCFPKLWTRWISKFPTIIWPSWNLPSSPLRPQPSFSKINWTMIFLILSNDKLHSKWTLLLRDWILKTYNKNINKPSEELEDMWVLPTLVPPVPL